MNVLVTGANSGIGASVAKVFAENGHSVYALDIRTTPLRTNLFSYTADITDASALLAVREDLDTRGVKLDCIINVAGMFLMDNFLEVSQEKLCRIFRVNVLGAMLVNKIFFPLLRKNGKIFITTSEVATLDPLPFNGIYAVSKTALDAYTQALRHEAGMLGAKVITVRPGAVKTPLAESSIPAMRQMSEKSLLFGGQADKFQKIMEKFTGKMLSPDVIAVKIYKLALKKHPKSICSVHNNVLLKLLSALPIGWQIALIRRLVRPDDKHAVG